MRSCPLKVLFFQSILSATSIPKYYLRLCYLGLISIDFHSIRPICSLYIYFQYMTVWPVLCKSVITSIEPTFLYIFGDNNPCKRDGFAFGIKVSISSQILETLVALQFWTILQFHFHLK